ncbi:MAG: arylsulfatase [Pirellulales bacterium]|nr:arylsulfatase [Pirellulales bacterium]
MWHRLTRPFVVLALTFGFAADAPAQLAARGPQPNIVLIVADDLGFSDLGCYGSEIVTPHLDRLARDGLRFTQFYTAGRGCPSRASLLTGLYPHQTGVGHMMNDYRRPGYRGNLNKSCATLAEILGAAGYQTMMCGKWHLTRHVGPEGPKFNWPRQRGFDRFYGTIHGAGSYFNPVTLTRDNQFIGRPDAGDYYYTDAISDQACHYVEQAARSTKPFFLYVAYSAPHWPLHAPAAVVARYRAKYATGWDELRRQRHRRMIAMRIVKPHWSLTPRDSRVRSWDENPYRQWQQRRMEVYAAQVDMMDQGIGRVLEKLRQTGAEQNTLVMFLFDNGGCAEEVAPDWQGPHIPTKTHAGRPVQVGNNPNMVPGEEDTYQSYGIAWANASNTPFRLYKHYVHEGGIATPLIACWPGVIAPGGLTDQVGHVIDLMPTCVEAAKTRYPTSYMGQPLTPLAGTSLLSVFRGQHRQIGLLFWEHEGNRAVRDGKWKLVSSYPGPWELYDMEADRTETDNLAAQFPIVARDMAQTYEAWAKRSNVEQWRK